MRKAGWMMLGIVGAVVLALSGAALAGEALEINGVFAGEGHPKGWSPNKPGYWDDEGKVALNKIPDTEKTALQLTSQSKKMHLFTKQFPVAKGDKVVVKALVKGKGAGSLGAYTYPGGGWVNKEFKATAEWTEFVAELSFPEKVENVCVVIGITPGSSVEFMDVKAEIVKQEQSQPATK